MSRLQPKMKEAERDSGYAWLVLFVAFINNMITASAFTGTAVYMVDWQIYFEATKADVGLISSIFGAVACGCALFVGSLIDRIGCRKVSYIGALIGFTGIFLSTFATSVTWLYVTFGVIFGVGHGLYFVPPIIIVQLYFEKKRALAAGISLMGHSSGVFLLMPILRILIQTYGWRGAMLLHTGFVLQLFVIGSFFRMPNVAEVSNKTNCATPENYNQNTPSACKRITHFLGHIWDLSLLTNAVFVQFMLSMLLSGFSLDCVYRFTPLKAVSIGMTKVEASILPSVIGLASTCSRLCTSLVADLKCVNRTIMCGFGIFMQGLVAVMSTFAYDFLSFAIFMGIYGTFLGL